MAVYKEEKAGTWRVIYRYTDWTGERKQTQKRGFKTKRDAQAWEREQQNCQRRCDFVVFRRTGYVEKWRVMVYSLCIIILAVFVRQA